MTYPPQPGHYEQQPQYGQPSQFPQHPYGQQQYGGHPGYPGGEPPKSKQGMIIAIIVIAVLVLGGGGVTVWLLNKDDSASNTASEETTTQPSEDSPADDPTSEDSPTDEPSGGEAELTTVAQQYADAINNEDEAAATQLMCDKTEPGTLYTTIAGQVKVDIGKAEIVDDSATVDFTVQGAGDQTIQLYFDLQDDAWCVSI
jgi:hypothetical protein